MYESLWLSNNHSDYDYWIINSWDKIFDNTWYKCDHMLNSYMQFKL